MSPVENYGPGRSTETTRMSKGQLEVRNRERPDKAIASLPDNLMVDASLVCTGIEMTMLSEVP